MQVHARARAGLDLSGLMCPTGRMGLRHRWSRNREGRGIAHIDVALDGVVRIQPMEIRKQQVGLIAGLP